MTGITENAIDSETLGSIHGCAGDAASMLEIDPDGPEHSIVSAVDQFVYAWQKGQRPSVPEDDDLSLTLGSLWGQQLVRKLGWQWSGVTFHHHGDSKAVGVFSPDRALAIYPFHFVHGCLENAAAVTILLSFNMLLDGSRVPNFPANGFENAMENVHHIVPRD